MAVADRDYSGLWEYKTVHARNGEFGSPYHLQRLLYEEAQAGWMMIEQLDTSSVQFRRSVEARLWDYCLPRGLNPYRTTYIYNAPPGTQVLSALILAVLVFSALGMVIGTVILFCPPG